MIGNASGLWSESAEGYFSGASDPYNYYYTDNLYNPYNFLAQILKTAFIVVWYIWNCSRYFPRSPPRTNLCNQRTAAATSLNVFHISKDIVFKFPL